MSVFDSSAVLAGLNDEPGAEAAIALRCLALAQQVDTDVVTADKAWRSLRGFPVKLIR